MKKYLFILLTSLVVSVACGQNPKSDIQRDEINKKETVDDSSTVSKSDTALKTQKVGRVVSNKLTRQNNSNESTNLKVEKSNGNFMYFLILLLAVLGEGYLIYQLWKDRKDQSEKINSIYNKMKSFGIGRVESSTNLDNEKILQLLNEIKNKLESKHNSIVSNENNKGNINSVKTMEIKKIENNIPTSERYLVHRANNVLKETDNREEAICFVYTDTNEFKLFEDRVHTSKIIANRDNYKDVVDFEGDASAARSIVMIKSGKCKSAEDKKWIVTEKAKIKFV